MRYLLLSLGFVFKLATCTDIDCTKLKDGFYKIEGECQQYYQCSNGNGWLQECGEGTSFNEEIGICDHSCNVPGCCPEAEECLDENGNWMDVKIRVPGSCTEYYICSQGGFQKIECASPLVFNPDIGECDYESNSPICIPGTTTTVVTTTTRETDKTSTVNPPLTTTTPHSGKNSTEANATTTTTTVNPSFTTEDVNGSATTIDVDSSFTTEADKGGGISTTEVNNVTASPTTDNSDSTNVPGFTITTDGGVIHTTEAVSAITNSSAGTTLSTTTTSKSTPDSTTLKPKGLTYVGFVVDDTGSMYNEIEAVKQWLTNCIHGSYSSCATAPTGGWLITTFNDPDVGDVLGPTNNINEIIEYIDELVAHSGGDCPELAISGLLKLAESVPDVNSGCKVFFFTDATAKDDYLNSALYRLYEKKGCTFLPWLTGCCGVCEDPCASLDPEYCIDKVTDNTEASSFGIDKRSIGDLDLYGSAPGERIYYNLASQTEGTIVLSDKPSSPGDMLDEMEEELTLGFCPTELIAGPPPLGYTSESDCNSTGSCWDRSLLKCFCISETEPCPKDPISHVTCDVSTPHAFYGNPFNCTTYYECSYGVMWLRPCPSGTVFDTEIGLCNHPWSTSPPCGSRLEDLD